MADEYTPNDEEEIKPFSRACRALDWIGQMSSLVALLLVENEELMTRPEALLDIIYAASEPSQEPDKPIVVSRVDYAKAVELAKQYEPPE